MFKIQQTKDKKGQVKHLTVPFDGVNTKVVFTDGIAEVENEKLAQLMCETFTFIEAYVEPVEETEEEPETEPEVANQEPPKGKGKGKGKTA